MYTGKDNTILKWGKYHAYNTYARSSISKPMMCTMFGITKHTVSQFLSILNVLILVTFFIQLYEFHKRFVPEDSEEKKAFVTSLMDFGVSLKQYNDAFAMNNIRM